LWSPSERGFIVGVIAPQSPSKIEGHLVARHLSLKQTRLAIVTFAMIMAITTAICASAHAESTSQAEQELFASVNQARRAQGLPALKWDDSLATAARRHAAQMAAHGEAQHQFEGEPNLSTRAKQAGAHFGWLSENVIVGVSAEAVHNEFMNSANHRANILDKDMDSVGIGVLEHGGKLFVVEDFAQVH
jgi:uncharacterized protein YkwD